MKRIVLLAFMLIGSRLFAQEWKVVEWDGKSQTEIRSSLKAWVADYFKSAKDVLQLDEPDRIIIKGNTELNEIAETKYGSIPVYYTMKFAIDIQIKESKYRYQVKDVLLSDKLGTYTVETLIVSNEENRKEALKHKGAARNGIEAGIKAIDRIIEKSQITLSQIKLDIEGIPSKTKSETENW